MGSLMVRGWYRFRLDRWRRRLMPKTLASPGRMAAAAAVAAMALIFLTAGRASAGFVIREQFSSGRDPSGKTTSVSMIQDNWLRYQEEGDQIYYLWNLENGDLVQVNNTAKMYTVGNYAAEIDGLRKYLKQMREELKTAAGGGETPTAQEPSTQASPGREVKVEKTEEKAVAAGYQTEKYRVLRGDQLVEEIWLSRDLDVSKELDYPKFRRMFQEWMSVLEASASLNLYVAEEDTLAAVYRSEAYARLFDNGYAMRQVTYDNGGTFTSEVIQVEIKVLPAEDFSPPKDFTKVPSEEFFEFVGQ